MAIKRETVEVQMKKASEALHAWAEALKERNFDEKRQKRDPRLRKLEAKVRKCQARLKAIDLVATRVAERGHSSEESKSKKKPNGSGS